MAGISARDCLAVFRAHAGFLGRALFAIAGVLLAGSVAADEAALPLAKRLTAEVLAVVGGDADRVGEVTGTPPAAPIYRGTEIVGYLFSTRDVVNAPGYASVPFDVIAGVTPDGIITGAKVIFHKESYIINSERRQALLDRWLANQKGTPLRPTEQRTSSPDFVAGASVSARLMRSAVLESARLVLQPRMERAAITEPALDMESYRTLNWQQLLAEGAVVHRALSKGEVAALLAEKTGTAPDLGAPDGLFVDVHVALATPPAIGRNLLGAMTYNNRIAELPVGTHAIVVASTGPYDFMGVAYHNKAKNYQFDRVQIAQGDKVIHFDRDHFFRLNATNDAALQGFNPSTLYIVPAAAGFDPLQPWSLELGVPADGRTGDPVVTVPVAYVIPATFVLMPSLLEPLPVLAPAWVEAWQDSTGKLYGLGALLGLLTLILALQRPLVRHRRLHRAVRVGFLAVVLGWLGWYAGGQLTIIHLSNFALAPFKSFDWGFYLTEPLIVVLALYTALALVLLGRGVFCGWLCPFGALQELLANLARVLRLPQVNLPDWLDRRLRYGKYATAIAVIGATFLSSEVAAVASEVEPFRTAITAHFARDWPYLVYALALLSTGLFVERFYCRFMCPLGGALAFLGTVHLFAALKRRPACGNPCRLCERACPVKAIEASGRINMNECFQCLDCQVEYFDDQRCPPLAAERKQKARRAVQPPPVPAVARQGV